MQFISHMNAPRALASQYPQHKQVL